MKSKDPFAVEWTRAKIATLAAAVGLYVACMLSPLVGPAGARTSHAFPNALTFLGVLVVGTGLSGLAWHLCRREARSGKTAPLRIATSLALLHLVVFVLVLSGSLRG